MLYGKYEFICRFRDEAHLPPFKGSTVRGLLGHALKRVVCALKRQDCPGCLLRDDCLYARMFGLPPPATKTQANVSAQPHPFVLEPPLEEKNVYQPGEALTIGLILFGEINLKLPYFVYAFDVMGSIGMGRRSDGRRGRFTLEQVRWDNAVLYDHAEGRLHMPAPLPYLILKAPQTNLAPDTLAVNLVTPLRFKRNGRLNDDLSFEQFVRLSLRRTSSLLAAFGDGEPALDYRGLIQQARAVKTVSSGLVWVDWSRKSNQQKKWMQLGGLVGRIAYAGAIGEYLPLLEFGARAHLGKNSSFGLGQYAYETG